MPPAGKPEARIMASENCPWLAYPLVDHWNSVKQSLKDLPKDAKEHLNGIEGYGSDDVFEKLTREGKIYARNTAAAYTCARKLLAHLARWSSRDSVKQLAMYERYCDHTRTRIELPADVC